MLLLLSREPATLSTIQQFFEFGVIHAETNIPTRFIGISDFTHDSRKSGGAIYAADNVVLFFNGTTNFFKNSANRYSGGTISAKDNTSLSFIATSTFTHNWAEFGGGAINMTKNVVLIFSGISNNSAEQFGGAVFASDSTVLTFSGNNKFFNNHVLDNFGDDAAIYTSHSIVLIFSGNKKFF